LGASQGFVCTYLRRLKVQISFCSVVSQPFSLSLLHQSIHQHIEDALSSSRTPRFCPWRHSPLCKGHPFPGWTVCLHPPHSFWSNVNSQLHLGRNITARANPFWSIIGWTGPNCSGNLAAAWTGTTETTCRSLGPGVRSVGIQEEGGMVVTVYNNENGVISCANLIAPGNPVKCTGSPITCCYELGEDRKNDRTFYVTKSPSK
jgi:hypothetical protein